MATIDLKDVPGEEASDVSRRDFLKMFASATFAGLVAPAVLGDLVPANAHAQEGDQLVPIPNVPDPIEGQDPIIRMMEDLRRALKKPIDQRRWVMVIDLRRCTGCMGCTISCVTENKLPPGVVYRPVLTETKGTFPNVSRRFIPRPCMQCDNPPCVPVCPANATWKRADGITVIDYDKCIGCRYCITACPYSARTFDSGFYYSDFEGGERQPYEKLPTHEYKVSRVRDRNTQPAGNARKCHFCIHRIEKGELPACIVSCMGRAGFFGDANDPESLVSELLGQPNIMRLKEELGTDPKVYYLV